MTHTQKLASYLLLTSAGFHASDHNATELLMNLRSNVAEEMTLAEHNEALELKHTLVYPRFF